MRPELQSFEPSQAQLKADIQTTKSRALVFWAYADAQGVDIASFSDDFLQPE
jgi:hypothetical protein